MVEHLWAELPDGTVCLSCGLAEGAEGSNGECVSGVPSPEPEETS